MKSSRASKSRLKSKHNYSFALDFLNGAKDKWGENEEGVIYPEAQIDAKRCDKVLKRFYQDAWLTNRVAHFIDCGSGSLIELIPSGKEYSFVVRVDGEDYCLGEDKSTFGQAIKSITVLSDFLAQLAVFVNHNA